MVGAVIVPYCCLVVGVVKQVSLPAYSCEQQVVYSSCGLLGLMTVYTVSVGVCLWVIKCVQQQESEESRAHEVDWQPRDMMFFMVGGCRCARVQACCCICYCIHIGHLLVSMATQWHVTFDCFLHMAGKPPPVPPRLPPPNPGSPCLCACARSKQ